MATIGDGAVRNTCDVDILLRKEDLEQATAAMAAAGFVRSSEMDVRVFLDGPDGKPIQGVHILLADRKVRPDYATPTPTITQTAQADGKSVIELEALVEMKRNSDRDKGRTHLRHLMEIGLIDAT